MKEIEFWFSIGSTYTYLSVHRLKEIEKKNNINFIWNPFSVRNIMIEMENIPFTPPTKKNKSEYMWRDIERRAMLYGFKAKVPVTYPLKEFDLANQLAVLGKEEGWIEEYVSLTYKRWFEYNLEPAIEPNLSEILEMIGLNAQKIIEKAKEKKIIERYNEQTKLAKKKKIFGSPTFIVKDELFWGDDRLEDAIKWLER